MDKRLALLAIRLLLSVNLLYAAIFLKFAGGWQFGDPVHADVRKRSTDWYLSRYFRLGSGVFETVIAVLLLVPKTARFGARLTVVWMIAVTSQPHFVLGYGWFFVDALMVMLLAVNLSLADAQASSHSRRPETALKLIVIR